MTSVGGRQQSFSVVESVNRVSISEALIPSD